MSKNDLDLITLRVRTVYSEAFFNKFHIMIIQHFDVSQHLNVEFFPFPFLWHQNKATTIQKDQKKGKFLK